MSTQTQTDELIEVPGAPDIPGLRFRKWRGEADIPAMVKVLNVVDPYDGSDRVTTVEALWRNYSNLRNSDAANDLVMVEVDGELIGYKRVMWWQELDGARIYQHFGFLHPEWRGKGLGTALVRHSEVRLREIAAGHPETGPRWLDSWARDQQTHMRQVLEGEGYKPVRYSYEMLRPDLENIPDVPMPEGLEVRPVKSEHLRPIWEAEVEAFRDHWGAEEPQEGDFERWQNDSPFQPEYWMVAWDTTTDEVAGMVRTFIDHESNREHGQQRGWTENISVRRPWRKRGLARALMARSMRLQKDLGMTDTALGVDAENPSGALNLYKSMGFQVTKTETSYRKRM
jgi:mycothiol synthase